MKRKIKFVKQIDANGCAPACIAMVTGRTYEAVTKDFWRNFSNEGLELDRTISYLADAGFQIVRKEVKFHNEINFARDEMLKPFAPVHIVRVIWRFDSRNGHLVVMDAGGELICPTQAKDADVRECYAITDVLGLYK